MLRPTYAFIYRVAIAVFAVCLTAMSVNSAEVAPRTDSDRDFEQFNRTRTFSSPQVDSKLMAARFAPYQVFPLAWYDLPDNSYCFRLEHVHSASSVPTSRGIVLEIRGGQRRPAMVLAEVDHTGVKWITKMVPTATADEVLELVRSSRLLDPSTPERPRYLSGYDFRLEVRVGRQYQFIWRQAPADDTAARGLESFFAVVKRLIEVADVPSSEVFYGEQGNLR